LIAQTPGCASLARSYSLSALPGRGWVSTSQTHVYKVPKFLTNAGTAEHFRVSPPEAVVCLNGITERRRALINRQEVYESQQEEMALLAPCYCHRILAGADVPVQGKPKDE
jgi:hypothetical protein